MQVSSPALWAEGEIEARENGFLWVKEEYKNEDQPLLLHSTEVLLQALYPSSSREEILQMTKGHLGDEEPLFQAVDVESDECKVENESKTTDDDMDVDEAEADGTTDSMDIDDEETVDQAKVNNVADSSKDSKKDKSKSKIPPEYEIYQNLDRCNNLAARIQSALLDVQYFRHRKNRDPNRERFSRENAKIRALEYQQQRLLSQRSESTGEKSTTTDGDDKTDGESNNEAQEEDVREAQSVRVARTINSIRALYPHLLPILNHARRNDKLLAIKSAHWKSKKKAMCWILGRKVFDTTTCKLLINFHKDASRILEGYIAVDVAQKIANDAFGSPDYWSKFWIHQVIERASPQILNPLSILAQNQDIDAIKSRAHQCDEQLHLENAEDSSPDIQQKYQKAVNKLHQRLTKLLINRFPKARVSIYGSCLSNLSLGKGADVDLSLWIPEAENLQTAFQDGEVDANVYERDMKRFVYQACHKLKNLPSEFHGMQAITRARVPVIKGTYSFANNPYSADGSIK
jgi:hypothetical protein